MSITQVSRITVRKGTNENLPQLATGEFGWSVDSRSLYIGNGGTDAPQIENIEVLTANSAIGSTTNYTYSDSGIGYTAVTGTDVSSPTVRTLQAKIDDHVSVRDYGALGDGATDDTAAINRALTDLFVNQTFQATRRALLFPAGTYIVQTSALKIPTYATLVGEGTKSSVIKRSTTTITNVVQTADSKNQIGVNIGTTAGTIPSFISISGMTFEAGADNDVFLVDQTDNIFFSNCAFVGNKTTLPATSGTDKACVRIESNGANTSQNVRFNDCVFENHTYGAQIDDEVYSVVFNNCKFENLYKGLYIGANAGATAPNVKVMGSYFNNIYAQGVHVVDGVVASAFNHYHEVGNSGAGAGSPATANIQFVVSDSYSIGDTFARTDADDVTFARIDNNNLGSFSIDQERIKYGRYQREAGISSTLADNVGATTTGLTFSDVNEPYVEIEYSIIRGATIRNGVIRITHDATNQFLSEEYDENNGTVGVTFSITNAVNVTTLNYATTSTGTAGTFKYSIRKIV